MKHLIKVTAIALVLIVMTATAATAELVRFTGNAKAFKRNGSSAGIVIKKGSVAKVVDSNDGYIAISVNGKKNVWVMAKYVTRAKHGAKANVRYSRR